MHLREAEPRDFSDMGDIQAKCNVTDSLTRFFIKNMEKYPTTYRQGSIRFCKRTAAGPGAVTFVVETDPSDYEADDEKRQYAEVIAFAIWTRQGTSPCAKEWQNRQAGWWKKLNDVLNKLEDRYLQLFSNVQCTFRQDLFQQILPILSTPFDNEVFREAWELNLFFVGPDWQRKGVGRMLMHWGLERAREEKVPVLVKSSALGARAYRTYGFKTLGVIEFGQLFNAKEFGGDGFQMMCWEPEECTGEWFDKGKQALEKWRKSD